MTTEQNRTDGKLVLGISASHHDTAAALVSAGEVIAAVEEERMNRVKHTNAFPIRAIEFCLKHAGVSLKDVDFVVMSMAEEYLSRRIAIETTSQVPPVVLTPQLHVMRRFQEAGLNLNPDRLRFVPHHIAHAASAWFPSGFDQALVVSVDGVGDDSEIDSASGIVMKATPTCFERLRTMTRDESLGFFYGQITKLLGFREFDEYKVMGLASYGDRMVYQRLFSECCTLTPDGWYSFNRTRLIRNLYEALARLRCGTPKWAKAQRDTAAACQELLERIVLHVLRYYRQRTGLDRLSMAGGVALNCMLNGKIAASGLFKDVFVQPASHDAGGALGAALYVDNHECSPQAKRKRIKSVYLGPDIPADGQLEETLARWTRFIEWNRSDDIARCASESLASGSIIGWVQSRSEFGPRALGNRSILADPRTASNRDVVNQIIKRREGFRPFAPSVLVEKAAEYFEMPQGYENFPFMLFVVSVREEQRSRLAAVTHVDGTARIHTVDKIANPRFWEVIYKFGQLTGIFAILNTSFNNAAEPIVDSVEDAIVAYLTTGLHYLVVGDYWVTKRATTDDLLLDSSLTISPCAEFGCTATERGRRVWARYRHESGLAIREPAAITAKTFEIVCNCDGRTSLRSLLRADGEARAQILSDIRRLWWLRLIKVKNLN